MKIKKKKKQIDLGVYVSNFETYTRYIGVAGEKQKESKKRKEKEKANLL